MSDLDKKYPLRLDTRINFKNLIPHFYISDNQTNDFYIKLTNDNKPVEVEDIIVVIAVINPNGNINSSFLDTKTEKGLIYCNLPNELKNVVGVYKARIMCISGEERIVSNTFEYKVDTDEFQLIDDITENSEEIIVLSQMLSRLSNMEIESQANETERTANENERIANETERTANENLRQQAENNRNTTEEARVVAELNRESTEADRVLGEQTRVNNERDRISTENERISAENKRKENENKRIEKENANVQAELNRVQAESNRVQAESNRVQAENARKNSEDTRNSNEDVRKQNELKRQSNENGRITNEATRISNEAVRVSNEEKRNSTALENKEKIEELYNTTVTKTDKLIKDTTNTANSLIENTTNKMNKLVEDSTNDINKLIEDTNSSIGGYAEAEAQRQANENERIANENERAKVNANRQQAEQARVTNERNRKEAETARASAERTRVNNESVRISNENVRKNNEEKRKEEFKAKIIEIDNALASLETPDMNTLTKNNTEEFIPTGDYNPATKKYVDDSVLNKVEMIYDKIVIYNDGYNILKNSTLENYVTSYLNDYYCYEYTLPSEDIYSNLDFNLRQILNKCREVAIANNYIVEIICAGIIEGITNYYFSVSNYGFSIYIDDYKLGVINMEGDFESGVCTRTKKTLKEYATKEYVDSNIPCKTVNRNELFRITSDEINHSLGESKLIFTITNSNIINENKRYMVRFSYKEKLGYLSNGVLNFNFETYTIDIYKSNDNTFKITINNFPTEFAGVEGEPTVTDLVLYEEEIQFINEKYLPNTVASKKYVDNKLPEMQLTYNLAETINNTVIFDDVLTFTNANGYMTTYQNFDFTTPVNEIKNIKIKIESSDGKFIIEKDIQTVSFIGEEKPIRVIYVSKADDIGNIKVALYLSGERLGSEGVIGITNYNANKGCIYVSNGLKDTSPFDTSYNRSNTWNITLEYYDEDEKYYANYYNIPTNLQNGAIKGSLQQVGNTVCNTSSTTVNPVALGYKNTGAGYMLGYENTTTGNLSTSIGTGNTVSSLANAFGFRNNVTGGYNIALGTYLTVPNRSNLNSGSMIIGSGGTLASDSLFAISTSTQVTEGNIARKNIKYPFEVKDTNDVYLRGANVFLELDNEPTHDNHLVNKKYVDGITGNTLVTNNGANGTLELTTDKLQTSTIVVNTDIILPTVTSYTEIHLLFEGSNGVTITTGATTVRWQSVLTIESGKAYEVIFTYVNETIGWLANYIVYN